MEIGIIGFGRFGELMVRYLSSDLTVYVSSRTADREQIHAAGGIKASLEETCARDIVIPSVPISSFESVILRIREYLDSNLLVDVCSVKEYPAGIMQRHLPDDVQILATHPMFGPDSAADSLEGKKIVFSPIRIGDDLCERIKQYLQKKGLRLIETTPENHDRQIARSQVLTHFIGRALSEFGAGEIEIDTEGYQRLLKILEVTEHDPLQLFKDLNRYNRYAGRMRKEFLSALERIDRELE